MRTRILRGLVAEMQVLLSDRTKWTQIDMAKTIGGHHVKPMDPLACRFCLLGAAARVLGVDSAHKLGSHSLIRLLADAARMTSSFEHGRDDLTAIWCANDSGTFEDVQEILAIARANAEGARV